MKKISFSQSVLIIALAVIVLLLGSSLWKNIAPSKYDALAQCITDAGGQVKVAYWCSACAKQEAMFKSAWRLIDSIECSSPGSSVFDLCPEISATPTWILPDGSTMEGAYELTKLAEVYSCENTLP